MLKEIQEEMAADKFYNNTDEYITDAIMRFLDTPKGDLEGALDTWIGDKLTNKRLLKGVSKSLRAAGIDAGHQKRLDKYIKEL